MGTCFFKVRYIVDQCEKGLVTTYVTEFLVLVLYLDNWPAFASCCLLLDPSEAKCLVRIWLTEKERFLFRLAEITRPSDEPFILHLSPTWMNEPHF